MKYVPHKSREGEGEGKRMGTGGDGRGGEGRGLRKKISSRGPL